MTEKTRRLFLIDGQGLIYRAYFALPKLATSHGQIINAAYGFTLLLFKLLEEQKPDGIIIAFDTPKPTFRHELFDQYKAQREKMPQELVEQLPIIKEIVQKFNIPTFEIEKYEADDVIGTLVQKIKDSIYKPVIVTGDRDLLQLVDEDTEILLMKKGVTQVEKYCLATVEEMLGFAPGLIPDYMGLRGDPSDNIPGIPGIGEKTAQKLIQRLGSLKEIIKNLEKIENKSLREKIRQFEQQAILSRELAIINKDVDLELKLAEIAYHGPDYEELRTLFQKYEFHKLLEKLPQKEETGKKSKTHGVNFQEITNEEELLQLYGKIKSAGIFSFLAYTNPTFPGRPLQGIAFALYDEAFLVKVNSNNNLLGTSNSLTRESLLKRVKELFQDEKIEKVGFDLKNSWRIIFNDGDFLHFPYSDVLIASYLLNPSRQNYHLIEIIKEYFPDQHYQASGDTPDKCLTGWEKELCGKVKSVLELNQLLENQLSEQGLLRLYLDIELPLIKVLYKMEKTGIKLDTGFLKNMSRQFSQKIAEIRKEVFNLAGSEFNLNSPKQLSQVLFEKMKLPIIKKTKTGYSTDVHVLHELSEKHAVVAKILDYRELEKLKNTYIDKLPQLMSPQTGKIYTCFNQTGTSTGRLSSNNPNLQNIPVRTELGRSIRNAFIAEEGNIFLSADYSQIELRILAHLSRDKNLREAFLQDKDIHSFTAAQLFNVDLNLVSEEMRRIAKTINFGIIYGMSSFGLAASLRISREDAEHYIEAYFQRYHKVKEYIDEQIKIAHKKKYVKTMLNRVRYLEGIDSSNRSIREFYERIAINAPIQGTAADLIKIAMIGINAKMESLNLSSGLILQIHDELIFEFLEDELAMRQAIIKEIMENCLHLDIPLRVNFKNGHNWGEL
ncbi:MAG TPA: DNA polymerase I [Atribacterota bacterium]|nr:DNA polymerase I [Atribacterota bacterium]